MTRGIRKGISTATFPSLNDMRGIRERLVAKLDEIDEDEQPEKMFKLLKAVVALDKAIHSRRKTITLEPNVMNVIIKDGREQFIEQAKLSILDRMIKDE